MDRAQAAVDLWIPTIFIIAGIIAVTSVMSYLGMTRNQIEWVWYHFAAVTAVVLIVAVYNDLTAIGEDRT